MRLLYWISLSARLRRLFAREADADARETQHIRHDAPRLHAGQRVEFNVHPGEDGPWYATEVRPISDAAEKDAPD
jgi:hypothetical protein